jgi:hypothetical protein
VLRFILAMQYARLFPMPDPPPLDVREWFGTIDPQWKITAPGSFTIPDEAFAEASKGYTLDSLLTLRPGWWWAQ